MRPLPELLRIARVLSRAWSGRSTTGPDASHAWTELEATLARTQRTRRTLHLAVRHGLHQTVTSLQADLRRNLRELSRALDHLVDADRPRPPVLDLAHWIAEVRQLDAEFSAVTVRWTERVLRVETEPVVLDGIRLGSFALDFGWSVVPWRNGARAFEVIALEPNPASGRDDVVHPHVDGRRLCAGTAAEPIRDALEGGRLADAFLLVRSVLANYNPDSPYVPLDVWEGFHCSHCGHRGRPGSAHRCDGCDADLCSDCTDSCTHCSDTRCPGCLDSCDACGDRTCPGCRQSVAGRSLCPDCRTTCSHCAITVARNEINDDRCPDCAATPEETPCVPTA